MSAGLPKKGRRTLPIDIRNLQGSEEAGGRGVFEFDYITFPGNYKGIIILLFADPVVRANLEKVNGVHQGACFPFWGKGLFGPSWLSNRQGKRPSSCSPFTYGPRVSGSSSPLPSLPHRAVILRYHDENSFFFSGDSFLPE